MMRRLPSPRQLSWLEWPGRRACGAPQKSNRVLEFLPRCCRESTEIKLK